MSIKSLASIIGALGVGMSGYAKGRSQFQENERQKVLAERDDKQFKRTEAEWGRQDAARGAVKDAYADVQPEPVVGGGIPEEQAVVGYKAPNGQTYADQSGAQQAMLGLNSDYSRAKRAADNLAKLGETDQAEKYKAQMKSLIKEGTVEALDGIQRGRASAEDVKKAGGKVVRTLGKEVAERFNGIGEMRASADTMVEDFITKDASGREVVNSRVVGKDGKPVVDDVQGAYRTMLSAKERFDLEDKEGNRFQQGQQIAETARAHKAGETLAEARAREDAKHNRAQENIAQQGIGLQAQRLALESKSFKKQTLLGQIEEIETATGVKLTPEEKKQFAGIGKKGGKAADGNALMEKIVEKSVSTWQENNPTATPGQVATYAASLQQSLGQAKNNVMVENTLKEEFGGLKPGTPEYAAKWQQAKEFGLTDAQLVAKGYAAPGKVTTVPNPMARAAAEVGAAPARAPGPRTMPPPVNSGNYNRDINAFDPRQQERNQQSARANESAKLQAEIARLEQKIADPKIDDFYRKQFAAQINARKRELAAVGQ